MKVFSLALNSRALPINVIQVNVHWLVLVCAHRDQLATICKTVAAERKRLPQFTLNVRKFCLFVYSNNLFMFLFLKKKKHLVDVVAAVMRLEVVLPQTWTMMMTMP